MYTIIEDCSPYYIRYTHAGIQDVLDYSNECTPDISALPKNFTHYPLGIERASKMLSIIPTSKHFPFEKKRVSLFITKPHLYYRAHKDGSADHISINYTSRILDDKCVTSWYSDEDLSEYKIDTHNGNSRECVNFDKSKHVPINTMIAKPNEAILFNTEIFHDWDNRQSENERVVLTLRPLETIRPKIYFETMKKLMFNL